MRKEETDTFNEIFIKGQTYKDVLSKKDIWKEVEKLYNGSLSAIKTISGDIAGLNLEIRYKDYKLLLTETDTNPLKIEVSLNLAGQYGFNVCFRDWTDKIYSFFGMRYIKTGNNQFDTKYVIQSKESKLIMNLLQDNQIVNKILENNLYSVSLNYDKTNKIHRLLTVKDRNTADIKALTELIELEFRIIDNIIS